MSYNTFRIIMTSIVGSVVVSVMGILAYAYIHAPAHEPTFKECLDSYKHK